MSRLSVTLLLLLSMLLAVPSEAGGEKTCKPPKKFLDDPPLDAKQKKLLKKLLDTEKTYGDCEESISCCLAREPISRFAGRLWGGTVRMLANDFTEIEIREEFARRRKSFENPVHPLKLDDRPLLGRPDAAVKVVEYSEYECPFCRQTAVILKAVIDKFDPAQVALVYKYFPLVRSHPMALGAARMSVLAEREGRFWEMYHELTDNPPKLEPDALADLARKLGLSGTGLTDPTTLKPIDEDLREGNKIGVDGVPAVYVNGREYIAFRDPISIAERILEELDRMGIEPRGREEAEKQEAKGPDRGPR